MYDFITTFAPHLKRELVDEIAAIADPDLRQSEVGKRVRVEQTL